MAWVSFSALLVRLGPYWVRPFVLSAAASGHTKGLPANHTHGTRINTRHCAILHRGADKIYILCSVKKIEFLYKKKRLKKKIRGPIFVIFSLYMYIFSAFYMCPLILGDQLICEIYVNLLCVHMTFRQGFSLGGCFKYML